MNGPLRIVWLQSPPWDGVWTRQNHFSRRFAAEGAEVLYVENPAALKSRWKESNNVVDLIRGKVRRDVEPRLHVMSLPAQLPGSRTSEAIARLNGARFARAVSSWLRREGWDDPIFWCRVPVSVETLDRLDARRVVYDVTDDYVSFAVDDRERALTEAREKRLIARAGQVFTTTEAIAERVRRSHPHVAAIRNGVDPTFFRPAPEDEEDPFPDIPRPRIGHIGLVATWVDLELLAKIGARWPGRFISIGPAKPEVREAYESIPGIVRIGRVHNLQLPRYLRAFDVCIMPHLPVEVCHGADPLKIIEYMSAGKPIVSHALRSVIEFGPLVDTADDHDAFLAKIEGHLSRGPDPEASAARVERARERSWDVLFERLKGQLHQTVLAPGADRRAPQTLSGRSA